MGEGRTYEEEGPWGLVMVPLQARDEVEHYTAYDERGEELCAAQEMER